jgi:hypothetical protein
MAVTVQKEEEKKKNKQKTKQKTIIWSRFTRTVVSDTFIEKDCKRVFDQATILG